MHGKTGSPNGLHLFPLYTDLSTAGYDVIAPYMPWSTSNWTGSMCEGMNYIDSLVTAEAAKGRSVIVAGHSMGGAHSLIYAATQPSATVKGIVTMAPGHFVHLSNNIQAASASSVTTAGQMVSAGNGDTIGDFEVLNTGVVQPITAAANDFLTFLALDQYPDIREVLPAIDLPVLWLAGQDDRLTTAFNMSSMAAEITSQKSKYQVIDGDHKGMAANSATAITTWVAGL